MLPLKGDCFMSSYNGGIGRTYRDFPPPRRDSLRGPGKMPTTRSEQIAEYDRRESVYLQQGYTLAEQREHNLFRAKDTDGQVIAEARRMLRDIGFIAEVDAASIATDHVSLKLRASVPETAEAQRLLDAARAIWRRSEVQGNLASWALRGCYLGRWHWEAQRNDRNGLAYIVGHDPRELEVWRDGFGVVDVAILTTAKDRRPMRLDDNGQPATDLGTYTLRRQITADEYVTFEDSTETDRQISRLGVVPVTTWDYTDLGKAMPGWAGQGYEAGLAIVDSSLTQIGVIGTRKGNPTLKGMGVDPGSGADLANIDAAVALPPGTDLQYLETSLQGLTVLVQTVSAVLDKQRTTTFEFLFTEAGAGASGLALSHRASGFVAKMNPKRESFYRQLARSTSHAVAVELGRPWSEALDVFEVDGGEALPMDVEAIATLYLTLAESGYMSGRDVVLRLMALGLVPEQDPDDYLDAIQAIAREERIAEAAAVVQRTLAGEGAGEVEEEPIEV
jgi:hypothetical protein